MPRATDASAEAHAGECVRCPARGRRGNGARRRGAAARRRGSCKETWAQERRHAYGVCFRPPALDLALPVGLISSRVQVLLSLLYVPRAMNTCFSRLDQKTRKIIRLGCGTRTSTLTLAPCAPTRTTAGTPVLRRTRAHMHTCESTLTSSMSLSPGSSLTITNLVTLAGLGLVLVNSRQVPSACTHTYVTRKNVWCVCACLCGVCVCDVCFFTCTCRQVRARMHSCMHTHVSID